MAKYSRASALDEPVYDDLRALTRCLHLSDFDKCYRKHKFIPHRLGSRVVDTDEVGKVLWFGPNQCVFQNNMYGNVSLTIPMSSIVPRFGCRLYYIDYLEYSTHCSTRLLLSSKDYDDRFQEVNLFEIGSPLLRRRWRHVVECASTRFYDHQHEVEIAIEVDSGDCRWLFDEAHKAPNDHSLANTRTNRSKSFLQHVCHRFNTFGVVCPNKYTTNQAYSVLLSRYPDMFEDDSD